MTSRARRRDGRGRAGRLDERNGRDGGRDGRAGVRDGDDVVTETGCVTVIWPPARAMPSDSCIINSVGLSRADCEALYATDSVKLSL